MARKPKINQEIQDVGAFRSDENATKLEEEISKMKDFENDEGFTPSDNSDSFNDAGEDTFSPDFTDTHDEVVLEDGVEVQLRVIAVNSGEGPKGPYKRITYEVVDEPFAKAVSNIISMPNANDDERRRNKKNLRLRDFMLAHGLDLSRAFNWNDLVGVEVWAILGVELSEQYGDKNVIKRYTKAA